MGINVIPVEATLGAEVLGVQLRSLDGEKFAQVEEAFHQHGVLIFHEQHLSREEQMAFGERFGDLEISDGRTSKRTAVGEPLVVEISNIDAYGNHITHRDHPLTRYMAGNEGWHTDSSYKPVAAKASILSAIEVTTKGGQTGYADMRAAYDALTPEQQSELEGLQVWHSVDYAQASVGATDVTPPEDPTTMRGAWHPLVSRHPATGRRSLFIGRHASMIAGKDVTEGQELLAELLREACQPPRIYSHKWQVGDVVIWDNRCMLHRATEWDLAERRVIRHVRIGGDPADSYHNPDAAKTPRIVDDSDFVIPSEGARMG